MASQKKVIVRQFDGALLWGYLPAAGILSANSVQLLDTAGRVQPVALKLIKSIAYVRDFNTNDATDPERLGRRTFLSRPRGEGLWLKLEFSDKDVIEGLAQFDPAFLDRLVEDRCVSISLPDPKSNCYQLLVPRSALAHAACLGLAGQAPKRKARGNLDVLQPELFGEA